jgi:hypothetical protein
MCTVLGAIAHGSQQYLRPDWAEIGNRSLRRVAYVDSRIQANLIHDCYSRILAFLIEL